MQTSTNEYQRVQTSTNKAKQIVENIGYDNTNKYFFQILLHTEVSN
jgi:hypothetical protein